MELNIPWSWRKSNNVRFMGTPTLSQMKKGFDSKFEAGVAISNEKQTSHGVIALCKLPTFWCLCFQCWSRPNFPTLCDQLHYHLEVHSELKILYYRTLNIKVTLLLNYLRPYENNPSAWDGLTPYSTYLYLDFNLCSMTKLKNTAGKSARLPAVPLQFCEGTVPWKSWWFIWVLDKAGSAKLLKRYDLLQI